jgi:Zn-dependent peptidase ImmA (M78 family)/transcriptional regulator with XRE-family HTH domain
MENLFGQRLQQARTMKGWSLRDLALATGSKVSHNALARYERGEMAPGSPILLAVADALEQPTDFFFRPFKAKLEDVRFRKKSSLTSDKSKAAIECATDFYERFCEAEELAGDVRQYKSPLPQDVTLSEPEEAEEAAVALRKKWKLGTDSIPSVVGLLEREGIKVCETELDAGLDGFCAHVGNDPLVVIGMIGNVPRKRMTCTHELAHVVLPLPEDEKLEEEIAKRFAGAFLLPEETFKPSFGKFRNKIGLSELIELKSVFGTSIMAIMKRAEQLDMITSQTFVHFCKFANQQGWRKKGEPGDERCTCDETPARFRQLVWRAVAEQQISLSKGAALLKQDLAGFRLELRDVIM